MHREIRRRGLGCRLKEEPKNAIAESLEAYLRIFKGGGKRGDRLVMKFCTEVGVRDVITHASLGDDRFRVFEGAWVEFSTFPLTCFVVFKTACDTMRFGLGVSATTERPAAICHFQSLRL